jgi:hypothetical protein
MKRLTTIIIAVLFLVYLNNAKAQWTLVYEEDFSSDPEWVTNNPSSCYWNSAEENYYAYLENHWNGTGTYAVKEIMPVNNSFRYIFDIKISSVEYSSGVTLGLFDSDIQVYYPSCSVVDFSYVDAGNVVSLTSCLSNGNSPYQTDPIQWSTGLWYHIETEYNASTATVQCEISQDGSVVSNLINNLDGTFAGLTNIGLSRMLNLGYSGYTTIVYVDNVQLWVGEEIIVTDDFEDGVINPELWVWGWGKRGVGGPGTGTYQGEVIEDTTTYPDGNLLLHGEMTPTGGTYGGETWLRTLYDLNDGMNHLINFTWSFDCDGSDYWDFVAFQICNGDTNWGDNVYSCWEETDSLKNLYLESALPTSSTEYTIYINALTGYATVYEGPDTNSTIYDTDTLNFAYPWFLRFITFDASSAGFPGGNNDLRIYNYSCYSWEATPQPPYDINIELAYIYGSPVPASGGNIYYSVHLSNDDVIAVDFDAWLDVEYENGPPTTLLMRAFYDFQPGWTIFRTDMFYPVPASWAAGNYIMWGRVGNYDDEVWDESGFPFVKVGSDKVAGFVPTKTDADFPDPFALGPDLTSVSAKPSKFTISSAYPNPFNPTTTLTYSLPAAAEVTLSIYDISGRLLTTLVDGYRDAGIHEVLFDASGLASGIYLARIEAGSRSAVRKLMLLK